MTREFDPAASRRPPTTVFSTDRLAPAERFEAWHALVGQTHDIAGDPDGFEARVTSTALDRMIVRTMRSSPLSAERATRRVRVDALDHVMLHLTTEAWDLEIDGRWRHVPAGSLAVNSFTRPFRRTRCAERGSVIVHLPRDLVLEALPDPETFHGHAIPGACETLLGAHVAQLARQAPEIPAESGEAVARATVQLLAATLAPSRRTIGEAQAATRAALATRCRRYIEARIGDPGLSPQAICRDVGLSRSVLYRLFASSGGVADYIRDRRLDAAMKALSERAAPRVSELARNLGFSDPAAFSRAFKAAFGCSPRDIAQARARSRGAVEDNVLSDWIGVRR